MSYTDCAEDSDGEVSECVSPPSEKGVVWTGRHVKERYWDSRSFFLLVRTLSPNNSRHLSKFFAASRVYCS